MKRATWAVAGILAFSTVRTASATLPSTAELEAPFVTGATSGEEISQERFNKLLSIAKEFPESWKVITDAAAALGFKSPDQLKDIIGLAHFGDTGIPEVTKGGDLRPNANFKFYLFLNGPSPAQKAQLEAIERQGVSFRVTGSDQVGEIETMQLPTICLTKDLSLAETLGVFVHEVTHILEVADLGSQKDILEFANTDAFIKDRLERRGSELDAFINQAKIAIPLRPNGRVTETDAFIRKEMPGYYPFFDKKGNLVDRSGLEKHLLDTLDYRDGFLQEIVNEYNSAVSQIQDIRRIVSEAGMNTPPVLVAEIQRLNARAKEIERRFPEAFK